MAYPGKGAKVYIGSSRHLVLDVNNATITLNREIVDISAFAESHAGWRDKLTNLGDVSGTISGFYNVADTTGQKALQDHAIAGTLTSALAVMASTVAGAGFKCDAYIESFSVDPAIEGSVPFSISFQSHGTVAASP